jgi:hypothetical protein
VHLQDISDVLDHVEENPGHAKTIKVIRARTGDHVYVHRFESARAPWLLQHHAVVVKSSSQAGPAIVCHFSTCGASEPCIVQSTLIEFSSGLDVFLYPCSRVRPDPAKFALACVGKTGYDSKFFNCEHFANLCVTHSPEGPMTTRSLWIATGIAGTAITAIGGVVGSGLWMAGKAAVMAKIASDKWGSLGNLETSVTPECCLCCSQVDVVTVPKCSHLVCLECGRREGKSLVCPVPSCYEDFFRFKLNSIS